MCCGAGILAEMLGMTSTTGVPAVHPRGEQPAVELAAEGPVTAETFAGRVHLEWEHAAPVTTMGQLAFFIEYLKQGGLFEGWVAGCPLHPERASETRRAGHGSALGAGRTLALRAYHGTARRWGECAAAGDEEGGQRGCGAPCARQDRGGGRGGLAARAAGILHAAAVGRAVDTRCRHHGEAAVRPSGGGRGELQPQQTGPALACLSQLSDG